MGEFDTVKIITDKRRRTRVYVNGTEIKCISKIQFLHQTRPEKYSLILHIGNGTQKPLNDEQTEV